MCPFLGSYEMAPAKAHICLFWLITLVTYNLSFSFVWPSVDITDHVPRPSERNIRCSTLNDILKLCNVYPLELTCCRAFSHFVGSG